MMISSPERSTKMRQCFLFTAWLFWGAVLLLTAPLQAAGLDQAVQTKGGEFSLRLPAGWQTTLKENELKATGDNIRLLFHFNNQYIMSIRNFMGELADVVEQDLKNVTYDDSSATIGGNSASVRTFHGTDKNGVRKVRRGSAFNPSLDPGHHGCYFLFDVDERQYARALPIIEAIEQSLAVGRTSSQKATPPPVANATAATRAASSPAASSTSPVRLEPYVAPGKLYALYKPADWTVTQSAGQGTFGITVTSADRQSHVNLLWARLPHPDMVSFMAACRNALNKVYPGVALTQVYVSPDNARGTAILAYPSGNLKAQGRIFFETSAAGGTMQEYAASEAQLAAQRPLLLNVLASVSFIQAPKGGQAAQPAPIQVPLVERRAPDGSLSIQLPADWNFLASQGHIIAGPPGGGLGFIFTSFSGNPMVPGASVLQGVIGTTYRRPDQTLPILLTGFGHRNPVVTSAVPDNATMRDCVSYLRSSCEAADLTAQWISKAGVDCAGAFKILNTRPGVMGQWSSIVAGVWGPRQDLASYYPLLEKIGNSFSINDQYARAYIAAGLQRLRALQQQTARAMADLNYARQDMQRAWEERQARNDYMQSKWDDYRRGNSYWVSDLEGGKVYHTDTWGTRDTATGDYYEGGGYTWTNFQGQNPNYTTENMREVSSYELEHGAPPR